MMANRVVVVDSHYAPNLPLKGTCVVAYRTRTNFDAEPKNINEVSN